MYGSCMWFLQGAMRFRVHTAHTGAHLAVHSALPLPCSSGGHNDTDRTGAHTVWKSDAWQHENAVMEVVGATQLGAAHSAHSIDT